MLARPDFMPDDSPFTGRGFADIFGGNLERKLVTLKCLRLFRREEQATDYSIYSSRYHTS